MLKNILRNKTQSTSQTQKKQLVSKDPTLGRGSMHEIGVAKIRIAKIRIAQIGVVKIWFTKIINPLLLCQDGFERGEVRRGM